MPGDKGADEKSERTGKLELLEKCSGQLEAGGWCSRNGVTQVNPSPKSSH